MRSASAAIHAELSSSQRRSTRPTMSYGHRLGRQAGAGRWNGAARTIAARTADLLQRIDRRVMPACAVVVQLDDLLAPQQHTGPAGVTRDWKRRAPLAQ